MAESTSWNNWILIPLWALRIAVSSNHVTTWIIFLVRDTVQHHSFSSSYHFYSLCQAFCLALEFIEISRFNSRTLSPSFYLATQTLKSVVYTWGLITEVWLRKRYGMAYASWFPPDATVFYVSCLYASYVLIRCRHLHQTLFARWRRSAGSGTSEVYETSAAVPSRRLINSSQCIIADSMMVIRALQWLNIGGDRGQGQRSTLRMFLSWICLPFKYAVCYVICLFVLLFTLRLPGEPRRPWLVRENHLLDEWNYPNQAIRRDDANHVIDTAPDSRLFRDEESIIDTINLHNIPQQDQSFETSSTYRRQTSSSSSRLLGPRYLCFLSECRPGVEAPRYVVKCVDDWLGQDRSRTSPDYIFISYTRRQFNTQLKTDSLKPADRYAVEKDKATLADFAIRAAEAAKVSAFWVDFECVRPDDNIPNESDMEDVYRICDVVRTSHSMAIILGPALGDSNRHSMSDPSYRIERLHEWGQRMWTVPEALLCPSEHRIAIYTVGLAESELVAKRNLASRAWEDASALRQLIDHYESSLHLTQLELISIALDCLQRRLTDTRNAGDVTYVLMGLLRIRPPVNKHDSEFQAFAKLSLANDSDKILERVICLRNTSFRWNDLQDLWGAKLWHINPLYQITNVGRDDTVLIRDAVGTTIDWQSLKLVDFTPDSGNSTWTWHACRYASTLFLSFLMSYLFLVYQLVPALGGAFGGDMQTRLRNAIWLNTVGPGMIGAVVSLPTPYVISRHLRHRFSDTQARLFGLQGKPDLAAVESHIFGSSCGRLKWSSEGADGHDDNVTWPQYTLIDTLTCTATLFRAREPPAMVFVGAREGGLLRVLMCSYDERRRAYVKETVIRMKSVMLKRLPNLDRFNLAVTSDSYKDEVVGHFPLDPDAIDIPDIPEFRSLDD